jgi:hypothetical protein
MNSYLKNSGILGLKWHISTIESNKNTSLQCFRKKKSDVDGEGEMHDSSK